ncbi:MAG: hypothetical protein QUU85_00245, partial [Candidatus Eisenbacteria bacterium]|nr:hypothetical protein [Candidatus Eisenbacteria bacterium]
KGELLEILEEVSLPPGGRPGVPTWFFGLGRRAREALVADLGDQAKPSEGGAGWTIAGEAQPGGRSVVLAGGPPDRPGEAWTILDVADPAQIASIGRKVPHYGKYGWLVFDGSTNVGKGSWRVRSTPLRLQLS